MKITVIKQLNNTLKCAFNSDYELLKKLKAGDEYQVEIKKPRNIKFHRKFFALINMLFENQDIYINTEDLRHDLIIESGYFEYYITFLGEEKKKPKSINFSKMNDIEFNDLYNAVIDTVVRYFHFDKKDIINNVEQYY